MLWASFSCRNSASESSPETVQRYNDNMSVLEFQTESAGECIKVRRTGRDLQIETDSSPMKNDQASLNASGCCAVSGACPVPSPPIVPRVKVPSPKDLKEMQKTSSKERGEQNMIIEKKSPTGLPPTPPTVPRMNSTPRCRKRLVTPPEMLDMPHVDEVVSEQQSHTPPSVSVEDLKQCPAHSCGKLQAKFCSGALSHPTTVAGQLGSAEDGELSETWKRFEQRKLQRKAKRRNNKTRPQTHKAELVCWSHKQRICGLMASKLAQPAEAFSYRTLSNEKKRMPAPQVEHTAFRKWTYQQTDELFYQ